MIGEVGHTSPESCHLDKKLRGKMNTETCMDESLTVRSITCI